MYTNKTRVISLSHLSQGSPMFMQPIFISGIYISENQNLYPDFHRCHIRLYLLSGNCLYLVSNA